jgi:NitT/TauT family transport system ATP-binding protein
LARPAEKKAQAAEPPAVRIDGLTKVYPGRDGPVQAIDGLSLKLRRGEFCAVVGPSGCGKTTLLRILAGLDTPGGGTVDLGARGEASCALVFQGASLFPWLNVLDNVAYGLWTRGVPRQERQSAARRHIEMVGLSRFVNAYPHQLSEGMRQRVAIARAFCAEPDLLLMDEPFASLDEQNRMLLQEELLAMWQISGRTVLFVTHSIDEAITLADRVVVMSARPARIMGDFPVPFDRPRDVADLRLTPPFASLSRSVWEILRREVLLTRERESVLVPASW